MNKNKFSSIILLIIFLVFVVSAYTILDSVAILDLEGARKKFIVTNAIILFGILLYVFCSFFKKKSK